MTLLLSPFGNIIKNAGGTDWLSVVLIVNMSGTEYCQHIRLSCTVYAFLYHIYQLLHSVFKKKEHTQKCVSMHAEHTSNTHLLKTQHKKRVMGEGGGWIIY